MHLHTIVRFYTEESSLRQTIPLSEAEAKDNESEQREASKFAGAILVLGEV